ncbi:GNAT family N-acetyltransferase [Halalkalibacter urbisdiaboli]|uniref:GNAT family N-acetyltransferase n=1 Tax=Halalkalibacter urbisdiaboli TaxID=1960589 RepID=UPI0013FDEC20|nr:GNAT family N-acetyltransferase [Halalkalibacter urbisdiaboli]
MNNVASIQDITAIALLKYKMFKDVEMELILRDDFLEKVVTTYKELYETEKAQHFIIKNNHQIIACAGAFIKEDIPYCFYKENEYGFIGDVYVEPDFRKRGYARFLTNLVIEWMTQKEIKTIRLLASSHARNLYESIGFDGTDEMVLKIEAK